MHKHGDHISGNQDVIAVTGAKLFAHKDAKDKIPGIAVGLDADDIVKVVTSVELEALDTPGHTKSHVCLRSHTNIPALFRGGNLFNKGQVTAIRAGIRSSFIPSQPSLQSCLTRRLSIQAMTILPAI